MAGERLVAWLCVARLSGVWGAWLAVIQAGPRLFNAGVGENGQVLALSLSMATVQIFYGSETDTALDLAEELGEALDEQGIAQEVIDMRDAAPRDLVNSGCVVIITSTFGDGEPPYNARDYHADLHKEEMPRLETLKYAVLALGDRSYPHYCQCGKDFDERLHALGATRILERHECDGDPAPTFSEWQPKVIEALRNQLG